MAAYILVVDDDLAIRQLVTQVLAQQGFRVATVANGREALASIAAERPDLVLLDVHMPVLSGWEVLAALQATHASIPVVLMTSAHDGQAEAQRRRAVGYLTKPFHLQDLLTTVARCLPGPPQPGDA